MTHAVQTLHLNMAAIERYLGTYLGAFQPRSDGTLRLHGGTVQRFLDFLRTYDAGGHQVVLTERRLMRWLADQAATAALSTAARRYQALARFFDALIQEGLSDGNPMRQFEAQFGKQRWVPIARAFKSHDSKAVLEAMRVSHPNASPLTTTQPAPANRSPNRFDTQPPHRVGSRVPTTATASGASSAAGSPLPYNTIGGSGIDSRRDG